MQPDYSYQKELINKAVNGLLGTGTHVLAAAPGAGKTEMAFKVIERMADKHKGQTMVFCHGQKVLRSQWADKARKSNLKMKFQELCGGDGSTIDKKADVIFTLPQKTSFLQKKTFDKIDFVVIDEAHHYFLAKMVQKFLNSVKPKYVLLLSGTPSRLISEGHEASGITVSEMLDYKTASDPNIQIWSSGYNHTIKDMDNEYQINHFTKKGTEGSIDLIEEKGGDLKTFLNRTMIACQTRQQAVWVKNYLEKKGVAALLSISTEESGRQEAGTYRDVGAVEDLTDFISGEFKTCIVVRRGILGFDYPELEKIIDMSCSLNPDQIFQLLCRSVRPGKNKEFIKLCAPALGPIYFHVMCYVSAMSVPEYYYRVHHVNEVMSFDYHKTPVPQELLALAKTEGRTGQVGTKIEHLPKVPSFQEMREGIKSGLFAKTSFAWVKKNLLNLRTCDRGRTPQGMIELAKGCKTPREFYRKHPTDQRWLKRHFGGFIPMAQAIWGIEPPNTKRVAWTKTKARTALRKFKGNRHDLKRQNLHLYKWLLKHGRDILWEKIPSRHKFQWTYESAMAEGRKVGRIKAFRSGSWGAYNFLKTKHPEAIEVLRKEFDSVRAANGLPKFMGKKNV